MNDNNQSFDSVMLDLETLGNTSNSVIVQLSAVEFDLKTGAIGSQFNQYIDPDSCVRKGLTMDASTVMWWLQQKDDARLQLVNSPKESLIFALSCFKRWCREVNAKEKLIWGNGIRFDAGLLQNALEAIRETVPWDFRNERDVRTMCWLRPFYKENEPPIGTEHDGISDCLFQINYLSKIYNNLNPTT